MSVTDNTRTEADGDTRVLHTACTLDCPDACSLAVTVKAGRIVDIDASPDNTFTDGWICAKVKRQAERVYAPERVLTPLIRTGKKGAGEFRSATWDEARQLWVLAIALGFAAQDGLRQQRFAPQGDEALRVEVLGV